MRKIEPTRRWSAASCARAARSVDSRAAAPSAYWTACGGPIPRRHPTARPSPAARMWTGTRSSTTTAARNRDCPKPRCGPAAEVDRPPIPAPPRSPDAAGPENGERKSGRQRDAHRTGSDADVVGHRHRSRLVQVAVDVAGRRVEHQRRIGDRARQHAVDRDPVERLPQRPRRDAAPLGFDTDQVGPRRRDADAAGSVGADRGGDQAGGHRGRATARTTRPACACATTDCGCGRIRVRW